MINAMNTLERLRWGTRPPVKKLREALASIQAEIADCRGRVHRDSPDTIFGPDDNLGEHRALLNDLRVDEYALQQAISGRKVILGRLLRPLTKGRR